MYRFKTDGRHLGKGIEWRKGQGVPNGFPIEDMLAEGTIELVTEMTPEPQKGTSKPITDEAVDYTDMTVSDLTAVLRERDLTIRGSKQEKIDRLLEDDKGGAND